MEENCLFCRIIKGEIPSSKVYEDEEVLAFQKYTKLSMKLPKSKASKKKDIE